MALVDTTWYTNFGNGASTGYYAVTVRPQNTAVSAGVLRRQFTAPAVGSERVFVCIVAGTTANVTDATWVLTRGAKTTDGTVTWMECTGQAGLNGDLTNTATWAQVKAATPAALGQVIKRSSGVSYQICTTAGAVSASEPTFSDTAGVTTTDTTAVWTSLGPVSNFTGGQAPHARLDNCCTASWFAAGNTCYVGDNHAETQSAAIAIAPPGSQLVTGKILSHNHSGSYPPAAADLMTGATVTTTGNSNITLGGSGLYYNGIRFQAGSGASGTAHIILGISVHGVVLDNCSLQILSTGATSQIWFGGAGGTTSAVLNNTTVKFGSTLQSFAISSGGGMFTWQNTASPLVAGSSVPAQFFNPNNTNTVCDILVEAVDLSAIAGQLVTFNNPMNGYIRFKDCKLHASATVGGVQYRSQGVHFIRCNSGAAAYTSERYAPEAVETTETSITRVGGAADPAGQLQSRKIVSTTTANWLRPFKAEPYAVWNAITGANVTVTVCGTINSASLPNNDDIWLELSYLGSASSPLGTIVTTTKASFLASNAAVASDSSTWNGGGSGAGWSPFKLTATLSSPQPGLAGYIHARVRVGKASTTYYIDPQITLS